MKFAKFAQVDAYAELLVAQRSVAAGGPKNRDRLQHALSALGSLIEAQGSKAKVAEEARKWIKHSARVWIYTGDPKGKQFDKGRGVRVYVAIEQADGEFVAVLLVRDGYCGEEADFDDLTQQAGERIGKHKDVE